MTPNSRLAVSVHLLAYLAHKGGQAVTSAELASSVGTNPVVIRRLLSGLKRSRLVSAHKGAAGGFFLGSRAERITLLDVYRAVEPEASLGLKRFAPNAQCPVGAKIGAILERAFLKAQAGMEAELQRITIGQIVGQLGECCPAGKKE
jgi:Rrf2 family protein